MLFDTFHICYIIVSALITTGLLFAFKYLCKTQKSKDVTLKIIAIFVVLIHYSELWVNYLSNGYTTVESPLLFPIYPCNVMMWLLLLTSYISKKDTMFYRILTEFVSLVGIVCAAAGILFNFNYNNCGLDSYGIFSGLFSHSVMLLGCIYLLSVAKVKIRMFNLVSVVCGLLFFLVDGVVINTIFNLAGLDPVNSMFLIEPPFENMPWLNILTIGIVAIVLVFIIGAIGEAVSLPKEERWHHKLAVRFKTKKEQTKNQNINQETKGE